MPTTEERTITLCREIAAWLRAVAMDKDETFTPEERRALIEIALAVERRAWFDGALPPSSVYVGASVAAELSESSGGGEATAVESGCDFFSPNGWKAEARDHGGCGRA